jgi:hypothetical protein
MLQRLAAVSLEGRSVAGGHSDMLLGCSIFAVRVSQRSMHFFDPRIRRRALQLFAGLLQNSETFEGK